MGIRSRFISLLKYLVTLTIAFGLLWYAFRDVSIMDMVNRLGEVRFGWVYLSVFLSIISHFLRGYRWILLLQPIGYRVGLVRSFWAVMVGYLANLAFPRMGEVTKCGVLKKTDQVKMSASMGTVVTERMFDVLTLLLITLITFLIEFDRLNQFFIDLFETQVSSIRPKLPTLLGSVIAVVLAATFIIYKFKDRIRQSAIYENMSGKLIHFKDGLLSIRRIENIPAFLLSTLGIWVLYYLMSYVVVFSIPETSDLDWIAGMAILVVGGLAMSAPVQGGIGTYHVFIAALLTLYGIDREEGVFFATILHTSQTLSVMFFGSLGLIVVSLLNRSKNDELPG